MMYDVFIVVRMAYCSYYQYNMLFDCYLGDMLFDCCHRGERYDVSIEVRVEYCHRYQYQYNARLLL